MSNNFYIVTPLMNLRLKLGWVGGASFCCFLLAVKFSWGMSENTEADSRSCDIAQTECIRLDDDDDYIATLQDGGVWDEDIDAELCKLMSMQDIREGAASSDKSDDPNPASSSEATSVADAVRRANESLSPKHLSSIWEEGVYDAIFTGNMTKWLDDFSSPLYRLVEPQDFHDDETHELDRDSKRQRVMNRTFCKVIAADHDETWQQSREELLQAGIHRMVELVGNWTQCETAGILNSPSHSARQFACINLGCNLNEKETGNGGLLTRRGSCRRSP